MKEPTLKIIRDLARQFTRYETGASVLKSELLDEYPLLTRLIEKSLVGAKDRGTLMVPELRFDGNETVGVFSDYGGEHSKSRYRTYSILVFGWNHAYSCLDQLQKVRRLHDISDTSEMSYKNLRYGPLARCLPEYLQTCDMIAGMLFTVAIHKDVSSVFGKPGKETSDFLVSTLKENGFGNRKPKVAEKLLRIVHIAAYLTAWLSTENQNLFWMSDNDEIVPNSERTKQTIQLFQNVLQLYSPHKFGTIGFATPNQMSDVGNLSDYLSITDLAAGAVEGYMTRIEKNDGRLQKPAATTIFNWLGRPGVGLKKHTMIIKPDPLSDGLSSFELTIKPEKPKDAILIPIRTKRV